MKLIISHPTSNQFNRSVLRGLLEKQMLGEFHTSVAIFPGNLLDQIGGIHLFSDIRRRRFDPGLESFTNSFPYIELGRILAGKFKIFALTRHEKGYFSVDSVYQHLDKRTGAKLKEIHASGVNAVYAYEDGALTTFRQAKLLGMTCFYDLPIGYWRSAHRILQEEKQRWPEWASTLKGLEDSEAKLKRKDEELATADRIFVASSFTAKTLKDYPGNLAPVEIIPYGFPKVNNSKLLKHSGKRPIKLLFVGGLSQRKGLANLFAAIEKLMPYVELTVVGRKVSQDCSALNVGLSRHTWIPSLPHTEILKLMRQQDLLIFPSLFEGFGMVITEAMSQGTPVITTERTAGPDLIRDGENGWLIEAGSTEALKLAIEQVIYRPGLLKEVGYEAIKTAENRPWEVYGAELTAALVKHQDNYNKHNS